MRSPVLSLLGWRACLRRPLLLQPRCTVRAISQTSDGTFTNNDRNWKSVLALRDLDRKWHTPDTINHGGAAAEQTQKPAKSKAYILPMFPYPSGTLHLGHLRVYTISDVLARFKQLQGHEVIHPIGWDAFGLPAENAALERGIHPETWTVSNIEKMKSQMMAMGGRWDWHREIRSCDPDFYKHTQRIFLELFHRGLAYQAESLVNYDPVDKTVLANEQVDANGYSWRSGAKVEKLNLKQWFLKITEFQKPLLEHLDILSKEKRWPEKVLAMQRNWLGRSTGVKFRLPVRNDAGWKDDVEVYTTRVDTLFSVQYLALSLNHPIAVAESQRDPELRAFIDRAATLPPDSKEGYRLKGVEALNPLPASMVSEPAIPVYVAPYVLADYGSGAVMGAPGHDTRDHAFWRQNIGDSPILRVVVPPEEAHLDPQPLVPGENDKPFLSKGIMAKNIAGYAGLTSDQTVDKLVKFMHDHDIYAEKTENWRLRDWLISRQRYWGTPIPIIHCNNCGTVPVPTEDLPVKLPELPAEFFQGKKGNPLEHSPKWKNTSCPKCGGHAERETDTMDTFMCSSWYFLRFLDPANESQPVHPQKADAQMPVDVYVGGVEHAILHLLYARFISKFLATAGVWPSGGGPDNKAEPFRRLLTQGMVHGKTYSDPETGRFLQKEEIDFSDKNSPVIKATGVAPKVSFEKMSKSKHNGVDPTETIAQYGADVTRAHMLFQAPVSEVLEWDESSITGVERWLYRVVRLSSVNWMPQEQLKSFQIPPSMDLDLTSLLNHFVAAGQIKKPSEEAHLHQHLAREEKQLWETTQKTIDSVTQSYGETFSLNTVISDLMSLTNAIMDAPHTSELMAHIKFLSIVHLLRMLAPVAPAVAQETWQRLHAQFLSAEEKVPDLWDSGFPVAHLEELKLLHRTRTTVVQVDGKRKFQAEIEVLPEDEVAHLSVQEAKDMVMQALLRTHEGKTWLGKEAGKLWGGKAWAWDGNGYFPDGWEVVVVGAGKMVNLVSPGKKAGKGKKGKEKVVGKEKDGG